MATEPGKVKRTRGGGSALAGLLLGFAPMIFTALAGAGEAATREYQLKAAFLYNFTKFVEWPAASFSSDDSPIVIGAYCPDPFTSELARIVAGRRVFNRSVRARRLEAPEDARQVHVVFVCAAEEARLPAVDKAIGSRAVLTVGETELSERLGSIIKFVPEDDKIRFEINIRAAERANLKLSAQLQKLAKLVREGP